MFVNPIDLKMNEPTQCDCYKQILVSIMSYKDNVDYAVTYEFSTEQLGTMVPDDIYNWVPTRCFRSDPGPNDNPTFGHSSSLAYYKKAISYYTPNQLVAWIVMSHSGNPTRSIPINDLIKAATKNEVRKKEKRQCQDVLSKMPCIVSITCAFCAK